MRLILSRRDPSIDSNLFCLLNMLLFLFYQDGMLANPTPFDFAITKPSPCSFVPDSLDSGIIASFHRTSIPERQRIVKDNHRFARFLTNVHNTLSLHFQRRGFEQDGQFIPHINAGAICIKLRIVELCNGERKGSFFNSRWRKASRGTRSFESERWSNSRILASKTCIH